MIDAALEKKDVGTSATPARQYFPASHDTPNGLSDIADSCEWLDALCILNNTTTRLVDVLAHAWQMRQTILNVMFCSSSPYFITDRYVKLAHALEFNLQGALESTLWADDKAVVDLLVRTMPGIRHDSTVLRDDLAVGFLDLCDAVCLFSITTSLLWQLIAPADPPQPVMVARKSSFFRS